MNKEIIEYMREHPSWYIILSRYPSRYQELLDEYKDTKHPFEDKVNRLSMILNMIEMMR